MEHRARRLQWASVFAALASEHRLQLVELLLEENLRCQEMQDHLHLSQPAISYHLARLENAGILEKERRGTRNCYRVRQEIVDLLRQIYSEGERPWTTP